jgi:purine nucleosidase
MRIVLDTDIGGDFDDANALALLLASPEVDLIAVTTVGAGASARQRAQVARTMLDAAGRGDVSVFSGFDQPQQNNSVLSSLAPQHCLNAWTPEMAEAQVHDQHAVDALIEIGSASTGETTLLCIGAMTNVAEAIRRNPDAMRRFSEIVAMSGAFASQVREANVAIDPEAADVVYRSGIPLRAVGHEQASRPSIPIDTYIHLADSNSRTLGMLSGMAGRYAAAYRTNSVILYDVSAVVAVLRPEWFTFRERTVSVELAGNAGRGMTIVETDQLFNSVPDGTVIQIADASNPTEITALFRSRVFEGLLP